MVAGRAGACLHTKGIIQAHQIDLLKVMPDDIKELRRTEDLSLWDTKETTRAISCSMEALVATERPLWLNLSGIKEKDGFSD